MKFVIAKKLFTLKSRTMNKGKILDFSGETIYCGVDVHKTNIKVNARIGGIEVDSFSQNPDAILLKKHFDSKFPGAKLKVVYEAGFCGFVLQRSLTALGVDCIVVNPADVPCSDKDRKRKDDKRDARKLCLALSKGEMEAIYIPDKLMEHARCLVRYRGRIVENQTRSINRIRQLMNCQGLKLDDPNERFSLRLVAKLQKIDWGSPILNQTLKYALDDYLQTRNLLKKVTVEIHNLSKEEPFARVQEILRTVDGIGPISAMVIQTEIGDINRFEKLDKLCGYAGLVPDIHSTNDKNANRGITKRSNGFLREVLIESSWMLTRKDPAMYLKYKEYCSRMNANKAIIRIAKHLLARIRYVWIHNEGYRRNIVA